MRPDCLALLRCPDCRGDGTFEPSAEHWDEREIREATLTCRACRATRSIRGGIAELLDDPPEHVAREAAGLERFARFMCEDGWDRARVLRLPYEQDGYWFGQATAMHQTLHYEGVRFRPGQRILDVGSNTCWASARFAQEGLKPIALDITAVEMQGLGTADWWFDEKDVYFDRVLGLMTDIPLATDSLDYAWCCQVLHHNDRSELRAALAELHRVLRPGGRLIVVNEPVRTLRHLRHETDDVDAFEGHEHAYLRGSYVRAARAAGFAVEVRAPWTQDMFTQQDFVITPATTAYDSLRMAANHIIRRWPPATRAMLAVTNYVTGGSAAHLVCTKPPSSG